jgi:hypothetical protein
MWESLPQEDKDRYIRAAQMGFVEELYNCVYSDALLDHIKKQIEKLEIK